MYGAGEAGLRLLGSLRFDLRFAIVGLLDDNPQLWGRKVQDLPIHRPDQVGGLDQQAAHPPGAAGHALRAVIEV
jgi:FlaA1/EpsC-like NDP-sugar epimerase